MLCFVPSLFILGGSSYSGILSSVVFFSGSNFSFVSLALVKYF